MRRTVKVPLRATLRRLAATCLLTATAPLAGCRHAVEPLVVPARSAVALSGGANASLVYAARTDAGIVLIDLGWWGSRRALGRALKTLGATPTDVALVFLTHAHRDHVGAWPAVRRARFWVAAPESAYVVGAARSRARIPRWADRLAPIARPLPGEIALRTFAADTMFVLGGDTLRAYLVPGHTPGSAVYLFRGVLFLGDAATRRLRGGFAPAKPIFSDDPALARASLERLWARLPAGAVRYVCTAHARCAPFTPAFVADVMR